MRLTKSLLLAAVVLGLISFLAALKPPVAQYPVVEFRQQALSIRVLLQPLTGAAACQSAAQGMAKALTAACPDCKLTQAQCLIQLSQADSQALSRQARPYPTLMLKNGVMQFKSADNQQASLSCQETAATGIGRCLPAMGQAHGAGQASGPSGSASALGNTPSPTASSTTPATASLLTPLNLIATAISFGLCLLIVATTPLHARYTLDAPASGIQKFHEKPVPRIGGLAIYLSLIAAYWLIGTDLQAQYAPTATQAIPAEQADQLQALLQPMLFAALPAFAFGFAEDLTRVVGVAERLLATMASAVLAWWLTGVSLTQLDTPGLDSLVALLPLSVAFTAFAVGGVANAVNIIDGFHGLASGFFILACAAIGLIAVQVADPALAQLAFVSAAVALGFFLVNYPFGRLFLGDGGAYLLGFWLAWLCVLLPMRNPEVSAWVSLLICIYPVTEVLYSIYRRLAMRLHMGEPDRAHLHGLLHQWLRQRVVDFGPVNPGRVNPNQVQGSQNAELTPYSDAPAVTRNRHDRANPFVAPLLWFFSALPMAIAIANFQSQQTVFLACLLAAFLYVGLYKVLSFRARMRLQCG